MPRGLLILLCLLSAPARAGDRALYLDLIHREADLQGVPPALADAVAMVETGYRADAIGTSGEIGMMQIMPATARQLGFAGSTADLFQPATNIHLGVQYLSRAWAVSGGSICRALMKYRAGLGEEMMSPLSITYCAHAMTWLDATGSDLAHGGSGAQPDAAAAPAPDPHVIALFPPLPEQAGLLPLVQTPAVVTQAAYMVPVQQAIRPRRAAAAWQARAQVHVHRPSPVDKTAAAVEAALSDN